MTMPAMNCDVFTDRLMAYLEHETDDPTRVAMDKHALECHDCGPLLADLRKLRADAAKLPELKPSRDLWSGIAARIEAPVVPIGVRERTSAGRSVVVRRVSWAALIAASLVAAASIGYVAAGGRDHSVVAPPVAETPAPAADSQLRVAVVSEPAATPKATTTEPAATRTPAPSPVAVTHVRNDASAAAVATLSRDYDREIARLHLLIEQRRNQLDPVTVAVIERNLQVIDAAIAECKKAVAKDPASRFLIESLNQSLQTKVELMRTAALLPART